LNGDVKPPEISRTRTKMWLSAEVQWNWPDGEKGVQKWIYSASDPKNSTARKASELLPHRFLSV
jgi:hypothetical protein